MAAADNKNNLDLSGKTVVITGATSGIGMAAVKLFIEAGAFVIGVGRSSTRIATARLSILNDLPGAMVTFFLTDLASQKQVLLLSEKIKEHIIKEGYECLDVLVNNAGVYLEKKQMTEEAFEKTFAVNHLAAFRLTNELLPLITRSVNGRVITVSSYAHKTTMLNLRRIVDPWPYIGLLAYKRSKLCNILFTYELNRRFSNLTAFAVDPGLVNTGIGSKGSQGISDWVWRRRRLNGVPPRESAKTLVCLADVSRIDGSQGYYFKNCQFKEPSPKATNKHLAEKLWALSYQLTGID